MSDLSTIHDLPVYALARLADCAAPDDPSSPGARFLSDVRDDLVERLTQSPDDATDDLPAELADLAGPTYTADVWAVFVDLTAWMIDLTGLWSDTNPDMTAQAERSLYVIAETLVGALLAELTNDDDA